MRAIITVTESRSMLSRFSIKCDAMRDKRGIVPTREARGEQAAAAVALEYAVGLKSRGYVIFAPAKVLDLIPGDMRERA